MFSSLDHSKSKLKLIGLNRFKNGKASSLVFGKFPRSGKWCLDNVMIKVKSVHFHVISLQRRFLLNPIAELKLCMTEICTGTGRLLFLSNQKS